MIDFIVKITAPDCEETGIMVTAHTAKEALHIAREYGADMLGVRAEHVVMRIIEERPTF